MNDAAVSVDEFAGAPRRGPAADDSAAPSTKRTESSARTFASYRSSKLDRLLCAHAYYSGLFSCVGALLQMRGLSYRAKDPGVGFDQPAVAFHLYQSALISLSYLLFELLLVLWPGQVEMRGGTFGIVATLISTLVLAKIFFVDYWLPRVTFRESRSTTGVVIPIIGQAALRLRDQLFSPNSRSDVNTVYFAGERPFVGYGTEVNSWSLVIDSSAPAGGVHDLVGAKAEPRPLRTSEMYEAVLSGVSNLDVKSLRCDRRLFIDGVAVDEEKRAHGRRYRRPPERLASERVSSLDQDASQGRNYLMLQMQQPDQDLLVTLFMRFYQEGKLIFCEFSSYVLPPGPASLYRMGHRFRMNAVLYSVFALVFSLLIAIVVSILYLAISLSLLELGIHWVPAVFLMPAQVILTPAVAGAFMDAMTQRDAWSAARIAFNFGLLGYAYVIVSLFYVCLRALIRGVGWLFATTGILFNTTRQFGLPFSYRERFSSRASLKYYALQEVVRFLKVQEKILIKSIYDLLKDRGIDTSDFKESLTAYINQGVINSGDIRGNVFTRIKSFVGRRPARSAAKPARVAVVNGRS